MKGDDQNRVPLPEVDVEISNVVGSIASYTSHFVTEDSDSCKMVMCNNMSIIFDHGIFKIIHSSSSSHLLVRNSLEYQGLRSSRVKCAMPTSLVQMRNQAVTQLVSRSNISK